jgi:RND superfamily putative drug exporter
VIGLFSLSSITFIKMLGVGMIVALILDATLVRMLLVPATLRLLGHASWWAPRPLARFYARYGLHEDDGPASSAVAEPAPAPSRSVPSDTRAEPRSSTIPRAGTADSNGGMQI